MSFNGFHGYTKSSRLVKLKSRELLKISFHCTIPIYLDHIDFQFYVLCVEFLIIQRRFFIFHINFRMLNKNSLSWEKRENWNFSIHSEAKVFQHFHFPTLIDKLHVLEFPRNFHWTQKSMKAWKNQQKSREKVAISSFLNSELNYLFSFNFFRPYLMTYFHQTFFFVVIFPKKTPKSLSED